VLARPRIQRIMNRIGGMAIASGMTYFAVYEIVKWSGR